MSKEKIIGEKREMFRPEVWVTIPVGGMTTPQLLAELRKADVQINIEYLENTLEHPSFLVSGNPWNIKLVRCKTREVAPTRRRLGPTTLTLYKAINEIGYACPAEVAPHLLLWAAKQKKIIPRFKTLMAPLRSRFSTPHILCGEAKGYGTEYRAKLWSEGAATNEWLPDEDVIFAHDEQTWPPNEHLLCPVEPPLRLARDPEHDTAALIRAWKKET